LQHEHLDFQPSTAQVFYSPVIRSRRLLMRDPELTIPSPLFPPPGTPARIPLVSRASTDAADPDAVKVAAPDIRSAAVLPAPDAVPQGRAQVLVVGDWIYSAVGDFSVHLSTPGWQFVRYEQPRTNAMSLLLRHPDDAQCLVTRFAGNSTAMEILDAALASPLYREGWGEKTLRPWKAHGMQIAHAQLDIPDSARGALTVVLTSLSRGKLQYLVESSAATSRKAVWETNLHRIGRSLREGRPPNMPSDRARQLLQSAP
jgi:hypothetical protein